MMDAIQPDPATAATGRPRFGLWQRILAAAIVGILIGLALVWLSLRGATMGGDVRIGPWTTARATGSADAGPRLRAIVALRGLLALTSREAIYLNAAIDSAGRALDGKCSYRVAGPAPAARWWSITAYDREGYLLAVPGDRYSVGSAGEAAVDVTVGPSGRIATDPAQPFELTLRAYNPLPQLLEGELPIITRLSC